MKRIDLGRRPRWACMLALGAVLVLTNFAYAELQIVRCPNGGIFIVDDPAKADCSIAAPHPDPNSPEKRAAVGAKAPEQRQPDPTLTRRSARTPEEIVRMAVDSGLIRKMNAGASEVFVSPLWTYLEPAAKRGFVATLWRYFSSLGYAHPCVVRDLRSGKELARGNIESQVLK